MFLFSGNIRQPKYGHLKDLHNVLKSMEKILLHGDYKDTTMGNTNVTVTNIHIQYKNSSTIFNGIYNIIHPFGSSTSIHR